MSDNEQEGSTHGSPFWRFSLAFYAVPGVAPACVELQDRAGVDVNVLFFLLWHATQRRALSPTEIAEIDKLAADWRDMTVVPLRIMRRALKSPPALVAPAEAAVFRLRIKKIELEAERLQQEALYQLAQTRGFGQPATSSIDAARTSVDAYQTLLGAFPAVPLEVVLTAFASFRPAIAGAA